MEFCVTGLQEMLDKAKDKKFPIWQAHMYVMYVYVCVKLLLFVPIFW